MIAHFQLIGGLKIMAKIVKINEKKHDSRLYDSDTNVSCRTEKVVDITEDCPKARQKERAVLLLFTRAKRGRIVQISRPYGGEVYMGSHTHFFVEELDCEMHVAPRDDTFGLMADQLGLTKTGFRDLIKAQAPA